MKYTIIIPTYNRPDYLKRLLSYYDSYNIKSKIIIADSSSEDNKIENKRISSHFTDMNILHIADYPYTISPNNKLCDILNYVNSEYSLFCADDDFTTPNGITQSINFLENNSDFSVAHGVYVGFSVKKNSENETCLLWKPGYPPESITFSDAKDRLYHHLANYSFPTFYGVHRTEDLKRILDERAKYTDDVRFGELLPTLLSAIHGKIKCLDVLYAARDANSGSNVYPYPPDYIKDGTYDAKYSRFKNCLVNHLVNTSNLEIEDAEDVIDAAMFAHMKKRYYDPKNVLISKMIDVLDYLRLPSYIDGGIRYTYRKLFITNHYLTNGDFPSSYHDDLDNICLNVLSSFQ